jgi:hypothetical protein
MSRKSKNKGKGFERQAANIFSAGLGGSWQRVPNSGAFIGGANVARVSNLSASQILLARGDLIPPDEFRGIVVECKARKEFPFHQLFEQCKLLESWIDQAMIDYKETDGKCFMVVFKPDRKGTFVTTIRDEVPGTGNHPTLDYLYDNQWYRIHSFNEQWLKDNSNRIKELLANGNS